MTFNYIKRFPFKLLVFSLTIFLASCSKLIEVDLPITSTTPEDVYNNDAGASGVLLGIYTKLSQGSFVAGRNGLAVLSGLSADELSLIDNVTDLDYRAYYRNALINTTTRTFWSELYSYIYKANDAIEGIANSEGLSEGVRKQLTGEAKFVRAFCYFYLVNLYGDVPLVVHTNYKINTNPIRAPKSEVYNFIISDLIDAKQLLNDNYVGANAVTVVSERTRPNKWVAVALLARVYLYTQHYEDAEKEASDIINNKVLYDIASLDNVFLKNSEEAIWQLQPVTLGRNTLDGIAFILPLAGPDPYNYNFFLSPFQISAFEDGDQRRSNWVDSVAVNTGVYHYSYKYKVNVDGAAVTEYQMVFRLAEQYLIRAEARAQDGDINGSQADINLIRQRAGLKNTSANDKDKLLSAITHERQVELYTEGQRWLDLKRLGLINAVMSRVTPLKGGTWKETSQLYPIQSSEMSSNKNLTQNPGY